MRVMVITLMSKRITMLKLVLTLQEDSTLALALEAYPNQTCKNAYKKMQKPGNGSKMQTKKLKSQ